MSVRGYESGKALPVRVRFGIPVRLKKTILLNRSEEQERGGAYQIGKYEEGEENDNNRISYSVSHIFFCPFTQSHYFPPFT
jgi:hypothetical protein